MAAGLLCNGNVMSVHCLGSCMRKGYCYQTKVNATNDNELETSKNAFVKENGGT